MTPHEQKTAAEFAAFWAGKGYEKGQTQPFWIGLLRLLGVEDPERGAIEFEDKAHIDSAHGFIDGYVPATHVRAVMAAYGFSTKMTESECVAALFERYCALAGKEKGAAG